jgi:3-deoxy-D-manno-octulosonic-acid transferase
VDIAVAGSSGLEAVIGVGDQPTALLTALSADRPDHVLLLAPRHLERRARE